MDIHPEIMELMQAIRDTATAIEREAEPPSLMALIGRFSMIRDAAQEGKELCEKLRKTKLAIQGNEAQEALGIKGT